MYVAVKGGEKAIRAAHELLAKTRRGDPAEPAIGVSQIRRQLSLAVDRVMCEGSLYDPELAALAVKQAAGDLVEAVFLLRAYRTTLPRLAVSLPVDTGAMRIRRRISASFKDLPGGQVLGPTFDYTHRLLDFGLLADEDGEACEPETPPRPVPRPEPRADAGAEPHAAMPGIAELLAGEAMVEKQADDGREPGDLTRDPLTYPAGRDLRLQALARGDEGFVLALGYSTQRGFGSTHPFAGEIRQGGVEVEIVPEELGFPVCVGEVTLTECQMLGKFAGDETRPAQFSRGYGLAFGSSERKAMSMALVDRALRLDEFGEDGKGPAQDQEFVLSHCDNVEASGFVQHLKLPHHVDFQAELESVRRLRAARKSARAAAAAADDAADDADDAAGCDAPGEERTTC
ncbi:phosphonate metabolism [Desulfovibrio sp. X2]|uniref:carbon-phosphorus lyase complex subunit PhnI n=1 Tax=Desulfovibrio sp. X2 TaxID=941449 RepID=UPI0003587139|nr:carbon-phosphorus lyase complex subunit PhnI [Desulfovibrio sp. X2]EPR43822.1 phosphonate metabolism [Desulfovibrio sp. X2]